MWKHVVGALGALLAALLLSGCVALFGGVFGKPAAVQDKTEGGQSMENLAEIIGTQPLGSSTAARDPRSGGQVEVRVENQYVSGTGESCRRASIRDLSARSLRYATACRGSAGWSLLPEILSAPGGMGK